jgi:hypothetical protein
MTDLEYIPLKELIKDKEESLADITICQKALDVGVLTYSGGSVLERLVANRKIVAKIDKELERRGKNDNQRT